MDNKLATDKQDSIRVDRSDPSEVEYLHQQYPGKTHEEIKTAINKAGPMRKDVLEYLNR